MSHPLPGNIRKCRKTKCHTGQAHDIREHVLPTLENRGPGNGKVIPEKYCWESLKATSRKQVNEELKLCPTSMRCSSFGKGK